MFSETVLLHIFILPPITLDILLHSTAFYHIYLYIHRLHKGIWWNMFSRCYLSAGLLELKFEALNPEVENSLKVRGRL